MCTITLYIWFHASFKTRKKFPKSKSLVYLHKPRLLANVRGELHTEKTPGLIHSPNGEFQLWYVILLNGAEKSLKVDLLPDLLVHIFGPFPCQ